MGHEAVDFTGCVSVHWSFLHNGLHQSLYITLTHINAVTLCDYCIFEITLKIDFFFPACHWRSRFWTKRCASYWRQLAWSHCPTLGAPLAVVPPTILLCYLRYYHQSVLMQTHRHLSLGDVWMSCFSNYILNHSTTNLRDLTLKWQERVASSPGVTLRKGRYCQSFSPSAEAVRA